MGFSVKFLVSLIVTSCLICAMALLLFFLIPREINLSVDSVSIKKFKLDFSTPESIQMSGELDVRINVDNENFVRCDINDIRFSVRYRDYTFIEDKKTDLSVEKRRDKTFSYTYKLAQPPGNVLLNMALDFQSKGYIVLTTEAKIHAETIGATYTVEAVENSKIKDPNA